MLFMKEAMREGLLRPSRDYNGFKAQLERLPANRFAEDKKFSPLGMNPYVLFRAAQQAENYAIDELVRAMETLLRCNIKLVTSGADQNHRVAAGLDGNRRTTRAHLSGLGPKRTLLI